MKASQSRVDRRRFLGQLLTQGAALAVVARSGVAAAAEAPAEILRKADEVRNPADSYFLRCTIKSSTTDDEMEIEASIQGNTRTLVKTLRPARDKGRLGLMVDQDMWAYVPNLGRAVRVTLSQRLVGQAANGDICRCRWSGDYDPVIESETPAQWTMLLTATKRGLTYEKLRLVIEKPSYRPLRAEFLTPQGKPLKRAEFREYKPMSGRDRPTLIHIEDALRASDFSDIRIVDAVPRQFPASIFYAENLK